MDLLRTQVINEHYRLIQQLENKYMEQISKLLKQKAMVHLALQQTLYTKLLDLCASFDSMSFQQQSDQSINVINFDQINPNKSDTNIYQDIIVPNAEPKLLFQQFNQTNINLRNQNAENIQNNNSSHNNINTINTINTIKVQKTTSSKQLKCNICNMSFKKLKNYTFHQTVHSLQFAISEEFPENYMDFDKNKETNNLRNIKSKTKSASTQNAQTLTVKNEKNTLPLPNINDFRPNFPKIAKNFANFVNYGKKQNGVMRTDLVQDLDVQCVKKWKCTMCDKRFATKNNMKQHQIIHEQRKDFKCGDCSFKTAHRRSLSRHKLLHVRNKPISCNICQKRFDSLRLLEIHCKSHKE